MTRIEQRILFVDFCVVPSVALERSHRVIAPVLDALINLSLVNLHIMTLQVTLFNASVGAFAALERSLFDVPVANMCSQLGRCVGCHITKCALETVNMIQKMLPEDVFCGKHLKTLSTLKLLSVVGLLSATVVV